MHLKRLEADIKSAGQEQLRDSCTSQGPDTNSYDPSVPTTPTIEHEGTPQTATISMESLSEPCISITLLCSQRQLSPSLGRTEVSSKDPSLCDNHPTPKQAYPSNTDLSISLQPSQHTVDDSYIPAPHLLSHDQTQRYPHASPYQRALPGIMRDLNVSTTDITILPSSLPTPF